MKGKKWVKWLLIAFGSLIALAAVAGIFANAYISKSKPVIEGEVAVGVLEQQVTVVRDDIGVPHIQAQSDADLYRAQGYVQGPPGHSCGSKPNAG